MRADHLAAGGTQTDLRERRRAGQEGGGGKENLGGARLSEEGGSGARLSEEGGRRIKVTAEPSVPSRSGGH